MNADKTDKARRTTELLLSSVAKAHERMTLGRQAKENNLRDLAGVATGLIMRAQEKLGFLPRNLEIVFRAGKTSGSILVGLHVKQIPLTTDDHGKNPVVTRKVNDNSGAFRNYKTTAQEAAFLNEMVAQAIGPDVRVRAELWSCVGNKGVGHLVFEFPAERES